jgi:hypothetical protein
MRASDFLTEFAPTPDFGDGRRDDGEYMPLSEYADIIEQYLGIGYTREDRRGGAKHLPQISVKFVPKDKSQNGAILYSFIHPKRGEFGTHNTIILKYDEQGVGHGKKGPSAVPKTQKQALRIAQLIADQTLNESTFRDHEEQLRDFVRWCVQELDIKQALPKIRFQDAKEGPDQHRTGYYDDAEDTMWIYTGNRNMIDIMRTVAHELTHRKQHEDNMVHGDQAYPGSPIEQQADAAAGYLMKLYGKMHPEIIE